MKARVVRRKKQGVRPVRRKKLPRSAALPPAAANADSFNEGFDQGFNKGYDQGFNQAGVPQINKYRYEGGEGILDSMLPEYEILPDISLKQVIEAGVQQMRPHFLHLLNPQELEARFIHALDSGTPMSLVRLGDGELLTLAQEKVMPVDMVRAEGGFLPYAGVEVPDFQARDALIESIRKATVVGIPKLRLKNYQPLAFQVFQTYGIDYRSMTLTDSLVNYYLNGSGSMSRILAGRRIATVGNRANELMAYLRDRGLHVSGSVSPVNGFRDVERVMGAIKSLDFDIALIASGISAVVLAERTANEMNKVAIDFGHLADSLIKGEAVL